MTSLSNPSIEIIFDEPALLGECPVWSTRDQLLYWVDIEGRLIHRWDPSSGDHQSHSLERRPGSIALTETPGRLLVASEHEVGFLEWGTGEFEPWVTLEEAGAGNRMNDGRADPVGRFWVGSMYEESSARRATGMLYRIEIDGSPTVLRDEVGVPNSLAFAPDGATMYWADTHQQTVWAYDYDTATGSATGERVFVEPEAAPGKPDGACVDAEGCLWVARVRGGAMARFTPEGELDRLIELPFENPTMPAFGGPDLETMFVTSLGGADRDADRPHEGAVLAIDAGVTGLPEPHFGG